MITTKGWGPWRYDWYSCCSVHHPTRPSEACRNCNTGRWVNVWRQAVDHVVFKFAPGLWRGNKK